MLTMSHIVFALCVVSIYILLLEIFLPSYIAVYTSLLLEKYALVFPCISFSITIDSNCAWFLLYIISQIISKNCFQSLTEYWVPSNSNATGLLCVKSSDKKCGTVSSTL